MAGQILHPSDITLWAQHVVLRMSILYPFTFGRGEATQTVTCTHFGTREEISASLSVSSDAGLSPKPTTTGHPRYEPCCQAHCGFLDVLDHPTVNDVCHLKFNVRISGDWSYLLGNGLGLLFDTPIDRPLLQS